MNIAFLFPGQGAQRPGFLHRLSQCTAVAGTLREAAAVLECDPLTLDSAAALQSTVAVQLGVLIAGVSATRALAHCAILPSLVAGHSVGAFTAAVASGALSFPDALRLVKVRAQCMQSAYPHGYGMAAIMGLAERQVQAIIRNMPEAKSGAQEHAYIAAINAPHQIVISGSRTTLESATQIARRTGARKAVILAVAVPSHCALMLEVSAQLRSALQSIRMTEPKYRYLCNHNARAVISAEDIREDLIQGIINPVLWHDMSVVMAELGTQLFVELPPGSLLSDLARTAFPALRSLAMGDSSVPSLTKLARQYCNP